MSELLKACMDICTDLQRNLLLVQLAESTAEEGYIPATEAKFDETVILLEIYHDRTSAMLERLEADLAKLNELYLNTHRNP